MAFWNSKTVKSVDFDKLEKIDINADCASERGEAGVTCNIMPKVLIEDDDENEYEIREVPGYITRQMLVYGDNQLHSTISSRHAEITKKDGQYYIKDISTNGTSVNGVKLEKNKDCVAIKEGDVLRFASHEYTVKKIYY